MRQAGPPIAKPGPVSNAVFSPSMDQTGPICFALTQQRRATMSVVAVSGAAPRA